MYGFIEKQAVEPFKLLQEANEALRGVTPESPEHAQLIRLSEWTIAQYNLCEATKAIQAAEAAFKVAAAAVELTPYDSAQIRVAARR